jgi:hypothetical protein
MCDVTCCIKTFERPQHVRRLVASIRHYYPGIPIMIADDSKHPQAVDGTHSIVMPFDSGLSAGRNELVRQCTTPKLAMLDDDFVFTALTDLTTLCSILDAHPDIDLVGGHVHNVPRQEFGFYGLLDLGCGRQAVLKHQVIERRPGIEVVEVIPNFFMARTERLRLVPWDHELKLAEHLDFFIRARGVLKIAMCDSVAITHDRGTSSPVYKRARARASVYQRLAERKHGIQKPVLRKLVQARRR